MDVNELEDKKFYKLRYRDNTMKQDEWAEKVFYYQESQKQDLKRSITDLIQRRRGEGFRYKIEPVTERKAKKLKRERLQRKLEL